MKGLLQFIGPTGSGKTTLCDTLLHELGPCHLLVLDASPDQTLSERLLLRPPQRTLSRWLTTKQPAPSDSPLTPSAQSVDWGFSELIASFGEDFDLLTLGPLPETFSHTVREKLTYGLKRLVQPYDFILIDGYHPLLASIFSPTLLKTVLVLSPQTREAVLPQAENPSSAFLLLNRLKPEIPSPELETTVNRLLESGDYTLIGRIPEFDTPEQRIQKLAHVFKESLYRLDLPFHLSETNP